MDVTTAQALVRFGLGRRGTEAPPPDPAAWLAWQLTAPDPGLDAPCHSGAEGLVAVREKRKSKDPEFHPLNEIFVADAAAAFDTLLTTPAPFRERLVQFWTNHFTVSLKRAECLGLAHAFVREAIRPHVNGKFGDMLSAVMHHPCMLLYLDNAQSFGPDSPVGQKQRRGLNENLARECLELHTVSPTAGYTQADVTAFANILTGWSIELNYNPPGFLFRLNAHQPGPKTLMGRTFPHGLEGGVEALAFLADHPATHRHLATKLVRHFVADDPPPAAVTRIETVLRNSGGDLKAASLELTRLPEAWTPLTKLRSPSDYVIAVLRAVDLPQDHRPDLRGAMAGMGQPYFIAPLPNGWPDAAADWSGPESILRRVDWAYAVSARLQGMEPMDVAEATLGPLLRDQTAEQMRRAGSKRDAFALLFSAPEFQRR